MYTAVQEQITNLIPFEKLGAKRDGTDPAKNWLAWVRLQDELDSYGGKAILGAGKFVFPEPLTFTPAKPTTFEGLVAGTSFIAPTDDYPVQQYNGDFVVLEGRGGLTDVQIHGNIPHGTPLPPELRLRGVTCREDARDVRLKNVDITCFGSNGLLVNSIDARVIRLDQCRISDNGEDGIALRGGASHGVFALMCEIHSNGWLNLGDGINAASSNENEFIGCNVFNNYGFAVRGYACGQNTWLGGNYNGHGRSAFSFEAGSTENVVDVAQVYSPGQRNLTHGESWAAVRFVSNAHHNAVRIGMLVVPGGYQPLVYGLEDDPTADYNVAEIAVARGIPADKLIKAQGEHSQFSYKVAA